MGDVPRITEMRTRLEALVDLAWARLTLRVAPTTSVHRAVRAGPALGSRPAPLEQAPLRSFAAAAGQPWLRLTCLPRAVALKRFLIRRGVDARLVVALARRDPPIGHAWVEVEGIPVLEDPGIEARYGFRLRDATLLHHGFLSATRIDFGKKYDAAGDVRSHPARDRRRL